MNVYNGIRVGIGVHLVKMPERAEMLKASGIDLGAIGRVVQMNVGPDALFEVHFGTPELIFWLGEEHIAPTSPLGVTIERPALREEGFYWVKDGSDWVVGEYYNEQWYLTRSIGPYNDADLTTVGPRLLPPEERP